MATREGLMTPRVRSRVTNYRRCGGVEREDRRVALIPQANRTLRLSRIVTLTARRDIVAPRQSPTTIYRRSRMVTAAKTYAHICIYGYTYKHPMIYLSIVCTCVCNQLHPILRDHNAGGQTGQPGICFKLQKFQPYLAM